jgi:hypothetical protein
MLRGISRFLTANERALAAAALGPALDASRVRLTARRLPLQPRGVVMAPRSTVWLGEAYRDDFADAPVAARALLLHELTHCAQHQAGMMPWARGALAHGRAYLTGRSAYTYALTPAPLAGRPFEHQATMVEDAYRMLHGLPPRRAGASLPALLTALGQPPERASLSASLSLGAPPLLRTPLR